MGIYKSRNSKIELEDFKGAIEDFNKAIELDPEYQWAMQIEDIQKMS